MEIRNISNVNFGMTYLKPSLNHMSKVNRDKLSGIYAVGELFPVDIFLGATPKGDLTVEIVKESLWKYLFYNNEIPRTRMNLIYANMHDTLEKIGLINQGKFPVERKIYNFMDLRTMKSIQSDLVDDVMRFMNKNRELFFN